MDSIVLDIETKNLFRDIGREQSKLPDLGVSLVGIYSYSKDRYLSYRDDDLENLLEVLKRTKQIIGFNLKGFDYPILSGHLDFDFGSVSTVDIMEDLKRIISRRISLNEVAKATLGIKKSADGLQAVSFYHQGDWEKLERYCLDDVRITKLIFDYGVRHKYVKIFKKYGLEKTNIPVSWCLSGDEVVGGNSTVQENLI